MKQSKWKLVSVGELGYLNSRGIRKTIRHCFDASAIVMLVLIVGIALSTFFIPYEYVNGTVFINFVFWGIFVVAFFGIVFMMKFNFKQYSSKSNFQAYIANGKRIKFDICDEKRRRSFYFYIKSVIEVNDAYEIIFGNEMKLCIPLVNNQTFFNDVEVKKYATLKEKEGDEVNPKGLFYTFTISKCDYILCTIKHKWVVYVFALILVLSKLIDTVFQIWYLHKYGHFHSSYDIVNIVQIVGLVVLGVSMILIRYDNFFAGSVCVEKTDSNYFLISSFYDDKQIERLIKVNKIKKIKNYYILIDDICNFVFVPLDFPIDKLDLNPKRLKTKK